MQVNNYSNNQSFGMALRSNEVVNKILKSKIKKPVDLEQLSNLIEKAAANDTVDIQLMARSGKLCANIFTRSLPYNDPNYFGKSYTERWFEGHLGFIKRLVRIADKESANIQSRCSGKDLDNVLNKLL